MRLLVNLALGVHRMLLASSAISVLSVPVHTAYRNLTTGDLDLIQDSNLVRGLWRLGIVSNTFPGSDVKVRKVELQYKNPKKGESVTKYRGRGYVTIERPVHRLVLLIPKDDISDF